MVGDREALLLSVKLSCPRYNETANYPPPTVRFLQPRMHVSLFYKRGALMLVTLVNKES